jgi:hypothetical protein
MARRGDTKPFCQVAQVTVAFIGVSLLPIRDGKSLVLCQEERTKASQAPMRHAWSNRTYPGACGAILASPVCLAVPAQHEVRLRSGRQAADRVASPAPGLCSRMPWLCCARLTAALNRTHHAPHLLETRPGGAQRTCLLSGVATSPVRLWACCLLPTSPRESRFSMAYSHPCESNPMTWR